MIWGVSISRIFLSTSCIFRVCNLKRIFDIAFCENAFVFFVIIESNFTFLTKWLPCFDCMKSKIWLNLSSNFDVLFMRGFVLRICLFFTQNLSYLAFNIEYKSIVLAKATMFRIVGTVVSTFLVFKKLVWLWCSPLCCSVTALKVKKIVNTRWEFYDVCINNVFFIAWCSWADANYVQWRS